MTYKVAVLTDGPDSARGASAEAIRATLESAGHQALMLEVGEGLAASLAAQKPQVAFVASDTLAPGSLQSLLELLDIPCVGSSSTTVAKASSAASVASAIGSYYAGFDGCASALASVTLHRDLFESAGAFDVLSVAVDTIPGGYPVVVKAAVEGSSAACKVDSEPELRAAVENVLASSDRVVVQEWVAGVMLSVSVLGDPDDPYALPPVEIAVGQTGDAELYAPVRLESLSEDESMAQAIRSEVERAAVEAYAALGCRDLGRIDIVWDGARAKILRVDTTPSMDAKSLFLLGCQVAELSGAAVVEELVEQAFYRA